MSQTCYKVCQAYLRQCRSGHAAAATTAEAVVWDVVGARRGRQVGAAGAVLWRRQYVGAVRRQLGVGVAGEAGVREPLCVYGWHAVCKLCCVVRRGAE